MSNDDVRLREKHTPLYFADGNVVILAPRKDESGLLFRVHKSVLSSHSPVFSDMFDVCNPVEGDGDHFYDGVPLICLSDDADHLASVLGVLYYQSELPRMPRNPNYPVLVTPILDLSRKYGIDRMHAQIVKHIERDWPRTLEDWDKLERDIELVASEPGSIVDDHFPEPASAIKLAHQFGIPSVLPAAFYHLSRLSILDDWDKAHASASAAYKREPTKRTARWGQLSARDFHCLLLGKAEFGDFLRGSVRYSSSPQSSKSGKESKCDVEKLWKDVVDRCLRSKDPLAFLKDQNLNKGDSNYHCRACEYALKVMAQQMRRHIWGKLGYLFHLHDA